MKISVLTENHAGSITMAEHGLSYLIELDGKRILFDTGQSEMFLRNAEVMNISMKNIDIVILSHGHFDHGNGMYPLLTALNCQHYHLFMIISESDRLRPVTY